MYFLFFRKSSQKIILSLCCLSACIWGCSDRPNGAVNFISPIYRDISLGVTSDSIHFPMTNNTYNKVSAFNTFVHNGKDYISFFDKQSASVNFYEFYSQKLVKRIELRKILPYKNLDKRTSVYVKSFDSVYVINYLTLYLIDGQLKIKDTIDFQISPLAAFGTFNSNPPLFKNDKIYLFAEPYLYSKRKADVKKWKTIYEFDMQIKRKSLHVGLPKVYLENSYSNYFFDISFCFNDQGKAVLSFPADSNIYEADMESNYVAYSGRSIYNKVPIKGVRIEEMKGEEWIRKTYLLSDSYSKIFFDPFRKRYMRIAEHKLDENEYLSKIKKKKKSIIFFDEEFRIIGESMLPADLVLSSLVFTMDGNMYTRVKKDDEYNIHLVRLEYKGDSSRTQMVLSK